MARRTRHSVQAPAQAVTDSAANPDRPAANPDRSSPYDERRITTCARTAGWSGLAFAALFAFGVVLVHRAPELGAPDSVYTRFYATGDQGALVTAGLYIVPFAGIAFLWHMSAMRTLIQALSRPPSALPYGLQLASGVVFVCMLFAGSAAVGTVAVLVQYEDVALPSVDVARGLSGIGYALVFIYGIRMAGMFMITTSTLARVAGLLPWWLAVVSYLAALFLLVSATFHPAIALVFPGWVVLICFAVLARFFPSRLAAAGRSGPASP